MPWNARINLTAIRNEEEIVTRHFGESLFAARHLFPRVYPVSSVPTVLRGFDIVVVEARHPTPEAKVADLGSGAGFPGVPIKLWAPPISLTLIESNKKRSASLRPWGLLTTAPSAATSRSVGSLPTFP